MPNRKYISVTRPVAYSLVVVYVTTLVLGGLSLQYANYVDSRSNHRWCGLVVSLEETYRETPPTADTGKRVAAELTKLRNDFGC